MSKGIFDKSNVVVILGQTATGKSDLAVKIAKKYCGEIISADSRQVYRGLDIGTGKITKEEMHGITHHLLDVASPKKIFTVAEFQKLANSKIAEIIKSDKLPIICGGTGFYIDAITTGLVLPAVMPNKKLRTELNKLNTEELWEKLATVDKKRYLDILRKNEQNNRVRIIRAIEIATTIGQVPKIKKSKPKFNFIKIGLLVKKEELNHKIQKRVRKMFRQGLLEEIENLKKQGISQKRLREFGFEYNNPTEEKVIQGTIKYAKRQMTWFKRDKDIVWLTFDKVLPFLTKKLKSEIQKQK